MSQESHASSTNYVGKVPRVNNVCFCFAFPFFPFPVVAVVISPSVAGISLAPLSASCPVGCTAAAPAHALTAGVVELPKIFLSDTFPLICGFCLEFAAVGSSGNSAFDSFGGAWRGPPCAAAFAEAEEERAGRDSDADGKDEDDPGRAVGALSPVAELVDHGVFLWPWRKAGVDVGPGVDAPVRVGNLSGNRCCVGTWFNDEAAAEELAAWATRSQTCREERSEDLVAVACFALSTRPEAIPAYPDPIEEGTRPGN